MVGNEYTFGALGAAMKYVRVPHPMFGFLCAGCGRALEEIPAWHLGKERFYCSSYCRDLDDYNQKQAPKTNSR